ncbi:MAG: DPP IV N-terminal domain-containing protein [Candidatus Baltobacteraceae bacterium]
MNSACMVFGLALAAALTFDQIFGAQPPWGSQPERVQWAPAGTSVLYVLPTQDGAQAVPVLQLDLQTRQARVLIDPARYGRKARTPAHVSWSPDGRRVAFSINGTVYVRDMATGFDRTIAHDAGDILWSPQSDALAYTRHANLFLTRLEAKLRTVQLTEDGEPGAVLNGELDWVYPEELGIEHGFAWSPSGKAIAYLRLDERGVTNFPIVDFLTAVNTVTYQRYPLPGERNPRGALHVIDVSTGADRTLYDAAARDEYVSAFAWKPKADVLVAQLLDRSQQDVRFLQWGAARNPETLYTQHSNTWVDTIALPLWLQDGTSVWILDRANVKSLYRRGRDGSFAKLERAFHVFQLLGADESQHRVFVSAAYPTRRDRALLAVPLDGGPLQNVTPQPGDHAVSLAPSTDAFVDTFSTLNDPPQTDVRRISGDVITTLAPRSGELRSELLPVQLVQVDSSYGPLDAYLIEPPGFDASKRYPAIVYAYGGPEAPTTSNRFGRMRGLYHQMLARAGFIVFSIDGPASQYGNSNGVRLLYKNFGPGSLLGQEAGAQYLRSLPFVDGARLGIWGWSFGGFETLYALTHRSSFKAGVAGSPVSDWHLYDSIYTERYMGLPQKNAAAYERSSVLAALPQLHGSVLVNHGTADDNVHMANSIAFLQAAVAAGKTPVDFFAYPRQLHGYTSLLSLRHIYEHMLEWWKAHL